MCRGKVRRIESPRVDEEVCMRLARVRVKVGDVGGSPVLAYVMLGLMVGMLALFLILRPR